MSFEVTLQIKNRTIIKNHMKRIKQNKRGIFIALATMLFGNVFGQQVPDTFNLNSFDIDEVTIQATRSNTKLKDMPNKVELVRLTPLTTATASDVGQLLTLNSSIDIIQYPGKLSAVGMRGFQPGTTNKYNVILVNGIPAGTQNISTIDLSMVEQVEVMKGPFSSMYGSGAMAGVINIVTPRSEGKIKGKATIGIGSYNSSKVGVNFGGTIYKGFNFDLNAYSENQGANYTIGANNLLELDEAEKAILDSTSYGSVFPNTKYSQQGTNIRLGYNISEKVSIDANYGIYSAKDVLSHGSFFNVYGIDKKDITRHNSSLAFHATYDNHNISITPYYHVDLAEHFSDNTDSAFIESNSTFNNYGIQLQDRISLGKSALTFGIDNNTQRYETERWDNESVKITSYKPNYQSSATGLFAQSHIKMLNDMLNITAGARLDYMNFILEADDLIGNEKDEETHIVFNPNIGAKYSSKNGLNIHGSAGTAFYAPDAFQKAGLYPKGKYTYEGNPELEPESSFTYDAGVGYTNKENGIKIDVTYFSTKHSNMILSVDVDTIKTYMNANEANMSGVEMEASYDFGVLYKYKFSLKPYINYTYMLNTDLKLTEENVSEDMKYVRKQKGSFGISFTSTKISVRLNGRYLGERIEDNWYKYYPEVRPTLSEKAMESQEKYASNDLLLHPDHLVFDASAYYKVSTFFTIGASVGNILNENYTEKDGYNMPGRNYMAKCVVSF